MDANRLQPESDDGNVEYKLRLLNTNDFRLEELTTQMRFRTNEGNGECIYILGVKNNGDRIGLSEEEYNETIKNINSIADKNDYRVTLLTVNPVDKYKNVYEVLIRRKDSKYKEIKIAVAGAVDSSKSSTIGVLTTGKNDDGRGSARSSVFNYIHELKSGRTSSIAQHIMGFDIDGKIINYKDGNTWEDIVRKSSKIVSFYDLCGHEAYLKTTILGIAATYPDFCIIVISANNSVSKITKEHIFLCISMKIPFIIILSKIDICVERKNVLDETVMDINKLLRFPGIRRLPFHVKNMEDVILATKNIYSENVVPIFHTSNVTGEGIERLQHFLNLISNRNLVNHTEEPVEFYIDQTFNVLGFGLVVGGQLTKGTIRVGDKLFLGPIDNKYQSITVKSIYCKKVPVQTVECGRYVCVGIKKKMPVKRGHVLVSNIENAILVKMFIAKINVLKSNSSTVKVGYEPILHTSSLRETVKIIDITEKTDRPRDTEDKILRSGDQALVTFEFKYNHHYLKENTKIILCEGITKIVGTVVTCVPCITA
jgi:GTPase